MILDTMESHAAYEPLVPGLTEAFRWLRDFSPSLPDGRHEIVDGEVFALVQSYVTTSGSTKSFEAHRRYLDLQSVVAGEELVLHAPVGTLQPEAEYCPTGDCQLYAEPSAPTVLRLTPGRFALFFPHDGHKPGCAVALPGPVRKVVIKIRSLT